MPRMTELRSGRTERLGSLPKITSTDVETEILQLAYNHTDQKWNHREVRQSWPKITKAS